MGVSKRQMQNFLIYILDMVGLTAGYFVAVYLRFGNLKTAYCNGSSDFCLLAVPPKSQFF